MPGVLNRPTREILLDDEAIDVSRITGIPWSFERVELHGRRRPVMDLWRLDWWDKMRVAFALIGGYTYLNRT